MAPALTLEGYPWSKETFEEAVDGIS